MTELEKEIDLLEEVRDNCYTQAQGYEDAFLFEKANILDNAIERLKRCGWIPCSERMPEDCTEVLICFRFDGCTSRIVSASHSRTLKCFMHSMDVVPDDAVKAWMPLPEQYKETL